MHAVSCSFLRALSLSPEPTMICKFAKEFLEMGHSRIISDILYLSSKEVKIKCLCKCIWTIHIGLYAVRYNMLLSMIVPVIVRETRTNVL